MTRRNPRADTTRIAHVLSGVAFPAAKWQLIIHAEDYGADATSRADLWRLPAASYPDLAAVLVALGFPAPAAPPAPRDAHREAPPAQAAVLDTV